MRTKVYWKLVATYLLAATLTLGGLGAYLVVTVRENARAELREGLRVRALLARDAASEYLLAHPDQTDLKALGAELARSARCRVTLIAADGTVLADSQHEARTMVNHGSRPEVAAARRDGLGAAIHRSDTLGEDFYYVAAAMGGDPGTAMVMRLAMPMRDVGEAGEQVQSALLTGFAVAVALIAALSLWLARGIVRPLREVGRAADALSAGDLTRRARVHTGDEVERLAETFNSMADHLSVTLARLRATGAHLEGVIASMADGVIVTDAGGSVTLVNSASEEMLGIAREDAVGRSAHEVALHFELGEAVAQCLRTGTAVRQEIRLEQPAARVLATVATPIADDSGTPSGAVVVLHDLTELRRLESMRRDFVANVSHELRTPVAAVRSLAETISTAAHDDPEAAERFIGELQGQTERLTALLDDLLELASLDSGRREMKRERVELARVTRAAAARLGAAARAKRHTIRDDVPESAAVTGDVQALERVVVNLLDNAIKYSPEGGQITFAATEDGPDVVLRVADDGPGIPEVARARVFERFYRVDRARSREVGGTGLGLSIVKHIVEGHGGEVHVESRLGEGSTFVVRLPGHRGPIQAVRLTP